MTSSLASVGPIVVTGRLRDIFNMERAASLVHVVKKTFQRYIELVAISQPRPMLCHRAILSRDGFIQAVFR